MKYINAEIILPEEIVKEIQKYIQGGLVYVPTPRGSRQKWGEKSGGRTFLKQRNEEIRQKFSSGVPVDQLSAQFCLSTESIKKIVYAKK